MPRTIPFMPQVAALKSLCCLLMVILGSCASPDRRGDLSVQVGIPPVAYFVERIAESAPVSVNTLLPPGRSPATYDPSPRDMAALSGAEIYFLTGLPFEEKLTQKMTRLFPDIEIFDSREGIALRMMEEDHPGDAADHIHQGNLDPHFWLDPQLVKIQSRNICDRLKTLDQTHADLFEKNLDSLMADLDRADSIVAAMMMPYEGQSFYTFHPAFGYFAERYGLRQIAIETAGKEPGARYLRQLVDNARQEGIRAIIVQREFSSGPAEAMAREIGGRVIVVDPLAHDYLDNFIELAESIRDAMGQP